MRIRCGCFTTISYTAAWLPIYDNLPRIRHGITHSLMYIIYSNLMTVNIGNVKFSHYFSVIHRRILCPHQHCNTRKTSKGNRMALNNGKKPQSKTAVNWLSNGLDEHYTEENDAIFSWNSGVSLLFMKWGFFCTAKRQKKQTGFFINSFI